MFKFFWQQREYLSFVFNCKQVSKNNLISLLFLGYLSGGIYAKCSTIPSKFSTFVNILPFILNKYENYIQQHAKNVLVNNHNYGKCQIL